mmetsp:Transcript_9835/g.15215  ORF Transcript_9835/g.15215 Transcript_9835/m.15215 type:complete len:158 (-) Transcript_9835:174-647(-)
MSFLCGELPIESKKYENDSYFCNSLIPLFNTLPLCMTGGKDDDDADYSTSISSYNRSGATSPDSSELRSRATPTRSNTSRQPRKKRDPFDDEELDDFSQSRKSWESVRQRKWNADMRSRSFVRSRSGARSFRRRTPKPEMPEYYSSSPTSSDVSSNS